MYRQPERYDTADYTPFNISSILSSLLHDQEAYIVSADPFSTWIPLLAIAVLLLLLLSEEGCTHLFLMLHGTVHSIWTRDLYSVSNVFSCLDNGLSYNMIHDLWTALSLLAVNVRMTIAIVKYWFVSKPKLMDHVTLVTTSAWMWGGVDGSSTSPWHTLRDIKQTQTHPSALWT